LKTLINEQNYCIFNYKLLFQKTQNEQNEQNSLKKFFPVTLSSKRGGANIDVCVMIIVSIMMIVISINVFSLIIQKQNLDYFSKELLNTAATYGRISTEVNNRYTELRTQTGLSPVVTWTANYYNSADREVQLADTITVKLTLSTKFQGTGEFLPIPITLTAGGSTLSDRYWK
jgi:hypothetical protein